MVHLATLVLFALLLFGSGAKKRRVGPSPDPFPHPPPGPHLTLDELRTLATVTGFADPMTAAAIAMAESGGYAGAVGDSGQSYGLWQINIPSHPQYRSNVAALFEPTYNAHAALATFQAAERAWGKGQGFRPWSTYTQGLYRKYMP